MVTVIIPSYNREKTIKRAVDSVLNQTYKDIEVIVVDDCSTDNTLDVVKSIKDSRLKVFKLNENSGACVARNFGIEKAKGEYIAFQDSDDEWLPEKLEKQMDVLENNSNINLVFCQFNKIDNENTSVYPPLKTGIITRKVLLEKSYVSTQTLIGRRECFSTVKFDPQMPRLQDHDLVIRLSKKYCFYFVNEPLVNMYVQDDSISNNIKKLIDAEYLLLTKYSEEVKSFPEFKYYNLTIFAAMKRRNKMKAGIEYKALYKMKPSFKRLLKYIYVAITDISRKSYKSFIV